MVIEDCWKNRSRFSLADLKPYEGTWVAFAAEAASLPAAPIW